MVPRECKSIYFPGSLGGLVMAEGDCFTLVTIFHGEVIVAIAVCMDSGVFKMECQYSDLNPC